ncbi:MAG: hypothetical protein VB080_09205 [Propionicimonas sp.]|uniref:hypothetical protein n=1 Tax=Propionicimonas sp. TaxID=1955623 RepID=UPI002B1EBED4|nr:hypothetical protein [Propionicimonas sp.]MEA4944600.1 hypothetical protein [Propionicimonas sp.]MEA5055145.1 hypothetical protein [Propionicimonas sp.]
MTDRPVVNTHVHFPPNFSAFTTVEDAIGVAIDQGVRAIGISNFYDQQVYARFAERAGEAGIVALFGLEFITLDPDLAAAGTLVNDPANPGRVYFCGKGISPFREKSPAAAATAAAIRADNDARATAMVAQLAAHFAAVGLDTGLTAGLVAADVAARGDVPVEFVSLQERHIARAFAEALAGLPREQRAAVLERAYGSPSGVDLDDQVALQGELRSRLLKVGTPGFVPEVPLSFADAYGYVLAMGGIPTFPILADGAKNLSPFEYPPSVLAQRLLERQVYAAELIPIRNRGEIVDEYVAALTAAGIIVMGGTEHNTADRIGYDPTCVDGPLSAAARQAFWEATCVVAAHQHLVAAGEPGYVDAAGRLTGTDPAARKAELIALGASLITAAHQPARAGQADSEPARSAESMEGHNERSEES